MVEEVKEAIKEEVISKKSNYTTIIAHRAALERLCLARDTWKVENRDFKKLGLMPFVLHLLDFYEQNHPKE